MLKAVAGCVAFGLFAQAPAPGIALDTTPLSLKPEQYASTIASRKPSRQGETSSDDMLNVFEAHKDMFTQDAWLGMQRCDAEFLYLCCGGLFVFLSGL